MFSQSPGYDEISDEEAAQFEKLPKLILAGCFTGILLGVMIVIGLLVSNG